MLKGWGVIVSERSFGGAEEAKNRESLLSQLGSHGGNQEVQENLRMLWKGYDMALEQEEQLRRGLKREAGKEELIGRLMELPGIAVVRACTFVAYIDTPWRFGSKQALWKYMGIGLVRERSGEGREYLHVELA